MDIKLLLLFFVYLSIADEFFLVSTHDEPNLLVYDLSGNLISEEALSQPSSAGKFHGLRGVVMDEKENQFYVANSYKKDSRILQFQWNDEFNKNLPLDWVDNFVTDQDENNAGLQHPYGIAIDTSEFNNAYLYASCQNSECIMAYDADGNPLRQTQNLKYPGCIVYYGDEGGGKNGVRGIAVDNQLGILFAAHETDHKVYAYDSTSLDYVELFYIDVGKKNQPVGLLVHNSVLYVGVKDDDEEVRAYEYSRLVYEKIKTYKDKKHLDHPAGMQVVDDSLYVISQDEEVIVQFDLESGDSKGVFIDLDKQKGEQMLYVNTDRSRVQTQRRKKRRVKKKMP